MRFTEKEIRNALKTKPYSWYCHTCHIGTINYIRFAKEHKDHSVTTQINFYISPSELDNLILSK